MIKDHDLLKVIENVKDDKSATDAAHLIMLSEDTVISAGMTVVALDSLPTYPLDGVKLKVKKVLENGYSTVTAPDGNEYDVPTNFLAQA